ncbi:MAG: flagellar biosynthesis protein FlhA [Spirochaetes bacterium]|nr:flagellar biosynthesis protein FlhA [Spirochaetota bacterium]
MSDSLKPRSQINYIEILSQPTMLFAVFLISVVLMLIIPVPAFFLDFLMALNFIVALMIILTVTYAKKAVDFSIFPTVLLTSTLFRLSVNVSSTRLILVKGADFEGKMIRAFGSFVVGSADMSGLVVGFIIFGILTIVQFIIITRGATRVAEVAARFSLDSMPNKYMAIDMDVQNGVIDENEAIRRRRELQEESTFYGNMDGASKFVQGDVIVGIIITLINVIGGFIVGMAVRGEGFDTALVTYIPLAVGDGLVSQIPSLLISTAAGLIVTRSQSDDAIGNVVKKQMSSQYYIFFIASGFLLVMSVLPGFPHIILFLLGIGLSYLGFLLYKSTLREKEKIREGAKEEKEFKGPENVSALLKVDPLSLYIGYELIPLVDKSKGAELLESITSIRRACALEMGIIVPPIRIQDNMRLLPNQYSFKIRGQEIGKGFVRVGFLMAMGEGLEPIEGEHTKEPAFGMPAIWIKESLREKAESIGYTVVDPPTIISTHIQEMLKEHASEILGREEVNKILENVKSDFPNLVEDILSDYKKAKIHKLLQELLNEGVSIRDMVTILETLTDHSSNTPVFDLLEYVRFALKRAVCSKFVDDKNQLNVLRFLPEIENEIYKNLSQQEDGSPVLTLRPNYVIKIQEAVKGKIKEMFEKGLAPVILCQPPVRRAIWEIIKHVNRNISVLSTREIISDIEVVLFGQIIPEEKMVNSGL